MLFSAAPDAIESHIFRSDADGGNVKQLTRGKFDFMPVCSADSKVVLYADADSKIEKVGIDGEWERRRKSWGCCRSILLIRSGFSSWSGLALRTDS